MFGSKARAHNPLQPEAILTRHGAPSNLQTNKRKLESDVSAGNFLPTHLEGLVLSAHSSSLGTISCYEMLVAYFKYK
jgi:hypothetical protein